MTNIFTVKLLKNGQLIQQRQVHTGLAESTGAVRIKAQADTVYLLSSESSKKSVSKITTQRVGNDIHMVLDDSTNGKPQLIIEGYFEPNQHSALATLGSEGEMVLFSAQNQPPMQATTEGNTMVVQTAKGANASWWGSPGVQLAMIAGGIFAYSATKNKSSDSPPAQPSQDSIAAYATGAAQATAPSEATYKEAGYTGVTLNNVGAINSALQRTRTKDSAGIQKIITTYQKLIDKANGNTADTTINDPTLSDYQTLGVGLLNIEAASKGNALGLLNDIVKSRILGDINTVSKIEGFASIADKIMLLAKGDPLPSALTTAELNSIGLSDVTDANIAAIRSAFSATGGASLKSVAQLKDIQSAYLKVLAQADAVKGNTVDPSKTPTTSELQTLGVTLGKAGNKDDAQQTNALKLLNDVIDGLNNEAVNSVAEISALATTIDKVMNVAKAASHADAMAVGLMSSELNALGLGVVTPDNLAQVVEAIRLTQSSDGSKVNTFKQMQSAIDLGVIMQYAESELGTPGHISPSLAQYQSAGVVTVDSGVNKAITNLSAINSAVEALKADSVNSAAELQTLVNNYSKILSLADGTKTTPAKPLTLADYLGLGALTKFDAMTGAIDGSNAAKATDSNNSQSVASLKLLNDVIDAKSAGQVDSIAEINALSIVVDKLLDQALLSPPNTLTINDFNSQGASLGIQNVTDNNLSQVFTELRAASKDLTDGSAIDTLSEIQSLVSMAVLKFYADNPNANNSTPVQSVYTDLKLSDFSNANWNTNLVTGVNSVIGFLEAKDLSTTKVKNIAEAYQSVLNEATGGLSNTNTNPTAGQYKEILKLPSQTSEIHLYESALNDTTITDKASNALALLNDTIRQKSAFNLTNLSTIESYATVVDKLVNLAEATSVTASTLSQSDLSTLGFKLNSAWSSATNSSPSANGFASKIAAYDDHGASIRSWAQIQTLIDQNSVF